MAVSEDSEGNCNYINHHTSSQPPILSQIRQKHSSHKIIKLSWKEMSSGSLFKKFCSCSHIKTPRWESLECTQHTNIYIFLQLITCYKKDAKHSEAENNENREISHIENFKDTCAEIKQQRQQTMDKTMRNNWKILPLLLDKTALCVFCGLEIYFYFVYIPRWISKEVEI